MFRAAFLLCLIAVGVRSVAGQNVTQALNVTNVQIQAPTQVTQALNVTKVQTQAPTQPKEPTPPTPPTTDVLPDALKYSCAPSKDGAASNNMIVIDKNQAKGLQTFSNIYAYKLGNIWDECRTSTYNATFLIIWGCWNSDVLVVVRDALNIVGGKDSKVYHLKCIGPDNDHNVTFNIEKSIKFSGVDNIHGLDTMYGYHFDVKIMDHHGKESDEFLIGETMTMEITSRDNTSIDWRVTSCTAYSAPVEIEFIHDSSVNQTARIADNIKDIVLGNKTHNNFKVALYAFHALQNNEVTYICTIDACRKNNGTNCLNTGTRRRRSISSYPVSKDNVQKKIYVYDKIEDIHSNSAKGVSGIEEVKMMLALTLLIWILK